MILLIGPLPPPVHGASAMTRQVIRLAEKRGLRHLIYSTSAEQHARGVRYHAGRALACAKAIIGIMRVQQPAKAYLSISAGWGLVYDVLMAAAARVRGLPLIIHHHSFAYLRGKSRLLAALIRVAGRSQSHIALCGRMSALLRSTYPEARNVVIVSNGALLDDHRPKALRSGQLRAIGFLSNITREKGIERFLDLVALLRERGWQHRVVIAGPIEDATLKAAVLQRCTDLGNIAYMGPVYGEQRDQFFASVDLMVLPTSYVNEAEPLVVLEAQQHGVPVAASDRGCIAEMIVEPGLLLESDGKDWERLAKCIVDWTGDSDAFATLLGQLAAVMDARRSSDMAARETLASLLAT